MIGDREAFRIAQVLSDDMDGFLDQGAVDAETIERFARDRGNATDHEALMVYLRHHEGRGPVDDWDELVEEG